MFVIELPDKKTSCLIPRSEKTPLGTPFSHLPSDKALSVKVKLSLSGGQLFVKKGGGCQAMLDFLDQKGFFYGT